MALLGSTIHSTMPLLDSTWLYHTTMALLDSTWLYYTLPWVYFPLLHSRMALLDSTWLYYTLPWLYSIVQWLYLTLYGCSTFYHGSTWLYYTVQWLCLTLLHSTMGTQGLRHAWGIMVVRTRASSGGSIEGCCGFPIWKGRQTLSVPACSEVVCRVGEHQHRWHIDVQNFTHT